MTFTRVEQTDVPLHELTIDTGEPDARTTGKSGSGRGGWKRADAHQRRAGRLLYFLLGFTGPRADAEAIKQRLATYMGDTLKLELSDTKTVITHARTSSARFLGYDIAVFQCDHKRSAARCRSLNGRIALRVPPEMVRKKCQPYRHHGKAVQRTERQRESPFSMVACYQTEYRVSSSITGGLTISVS